MSTRYDADSASMGFRSSDELAAWQREQSRASLAKPQPVGGALPWTQKTALEKAPSIIMQLEVAAERFTRYSHDSIDGLLQEAADAIRALAKPGALPEGWVPLNITFEGGDPEEVAYGPQIMMDRLKKWLDKYYATLSAPVAQPPKCATCNDNGMIGGPSYYAPDEGGVPCPDCAVAQPGEAVSYEQIDELLADHAKGSREMHDFARNVLRLVTPIAAQPAAAEPSDDWFKSEVIRAGNDGYAQGLIDGKALAAPAQAAAVPEAVEHKATLHETPYSRQLAKERKEQS